MAVYNKEFTVKNGLVVENNNSVKLSTSTGTLRYVSIKAPTSLTGDYTLTFPVDDGQADEMLITDGNGVLCLGKGQYHQYVCKLCNTSYLGRYW